MAFGKNLMGSFKVGVPTRVRRQLPPGFGGMVNLPMAGALEMTAFSKKVDMPDIGKTNSMASQMFTDSQSNANTDPVMNRGMTFKKAMDARLGRTMADARVAQEDTARGATTNTVVYRRS